MGVRRVGRSLSRRSGAQVVLGVGAVAVASIALALPASGHEVTGVSANCDHVTIEWTGFPEAGVPVHIAVQVGAVGSTSADVVVSQITTQTNVSISSLTSQMHGESADVDVDITWTFSGPQHVHRTISVMCGTATTTSQAESVSSTTTSTVGGLNETTTTLAGAGSTTTIVVSGAGETSTTTVAGVSGPNETPNGAVSATGASSPASLPVTGSATTVLLLLGLACVLGGATIVLAPRRHNT
jgi:LPXTG-motif cell wall-anchored protein